MTVSTLSTNWNTLAEAIMTENLVSIRDDATFPEAVSFLIDKGFRAAPVIDASGRPVGVISQSDIVTHEREQLANGSRHNFYQCDDLAAKEAPDKAGSETRVRDMMTPAVFKVPSHANLSRVVEEMVALNIHRVFVVGPDGVLIGVITALDLLRHIYQELRGQTKDLLRRA